MSEASVVTSQGEPEVDEGTAAAIRRFSAKIDQAEEARQRKEYRETIQQNRLYVRGKVHDDGAPGLVRTNLIHSTIATLVPHIYAKDPDVVCSPNERVSPSGYEVVKKFAKTSEIILQETLVKRGRLKKRVKSNIRSIFTTGTGWLKMIYQKDLSYDPLTQSRIQDAQDNLRTAKALRLKLKRESDIENQRLIEQDIEKQIEAIKAQAEPSVMYGFVIDRVLSEDMLVLDDSITDFDDYVHADAIAQAVWMNDEKYEETFGYKPSGASFKSELMPAHMRQEAETKGVNYRRVYEIWSLKDHHIYTLCGGEKRWARDPYMLAHLPQRFYPFYATCFFPVDGQWHPLDLVSLTKELQDEYNKTRTTFAEHREDSLPVRIVRQGGSISPEDVENIRARKAREIIVVNGNGQGNPLGNDMGHLPNIPLDPAMYDVSAIRADMDIVSGTPDASRGQLTEAKTATEAQILQEGLASRSGDMRDVVEDLLGELFSDGLQTLLQCLTPEDAMRIAGEDAVWPTVDKQAVYSMVSVSVRGGSTARPNKDQEKQRWIEVLPVLKEFIMGIAEVIAGGNHPLAQSMLNLLKETLTRFDERLDIQSIMPFASQDGQTLDQTGMQAQLQLQQLQASTQEMQQYIQQLEAELQEAQGVVQDKGAERDMKLVDSTESREADMQKARLEAETKKELEALKVEAQLDLEERKALQAERDRQAQMAEKAHVEDKGKQSTDQLMQAMKVMQETLNAIKDKKPRGAKIVRNADGTPQSIVTDDGAQMSIATDENGLVTEIG